jgi:tetratricopeptide (TPR) repeat protein
MILFVSASMAGSDFEPLDLLDSNMPDINDTNAVPMDFVDNAQANLLTKMDYSTGLQQQLQNLIGQINSIQFKPKEEPKKEVQIVADQNIAAENTQAKEEKKSETIAEKVNAINPEAKYENASLNSDISSQTISKLDELIANPNDVSNPLELANILYNCGKMKEAAVFYHCAYECQNNNDVMYQDKAWILFQEGNCLQKENPQEAVKAYRRLIAEYPNSFWADSAKAKDHLVEWYIEQKPNTFLKKTK